jgi:hypothetical protein
LRSFARSAPRSLNDIGVAIEARTDGPRPSSRRAPTRPTRTARAFAVAETAFGDEHRARTAELAQIDQRIDEAELQERRRADAAARAATTRASRASR